MNPTKIEYCDFTWNPVAGCTFGCSYCYARRIAKRFGKTHQEQDFEPTFHPKRLEEPLRVKKPSTILVCSMGDLLDRKIAADEIAQVFDIMRRAKWHRFLVLTKQAARLNAWASAYWAEPSLPNVWLGVSCETQRAAEERIPLLLETPAAHRWVSLEPLLGPVNLTPYMVRQPGGVDWIVVGAQTGLGAKSPETIWVQNITHDAIAWGRPVFEKNNLLAESRFLIQRKPW